MWLTTPRLVLREFVTGDWQSVLAYQREPMYLRYYAWEDRTEEDVQAFVDWFVANQTETPRRKFQLAIVHAASGELIGNCGVRVSDSVLREGDIGFEIAIQHWGQGYATEAATEILRFGFEELYLHRIWSTCVVENLGSALVLEKIGMRQEGCLKEREYYKGKWWDHRIYAILDHEWMQIAKANPRSS